MEGTSSTSSGTLKYLVEYGNNAWTSSFKIDAPSPEITDFIKHLCNTTIPKTAHGSIWGKVKWIRVYELKNEASYELPTDGSVNLAATRTITAPKGPPED